MCTFWHVCSPISNLIYLSGKLGQDQSGIVVQDHARVLEDHKDFHWDGKR